MEPDWACSVVCFVHIHTYIVCASHVPYYVPHNLKYPNYGLLVSEDLGMKERILIVVPSHPSSFHFLLHSFILSRPKARLRAHGCDPASLKANQRVSQDVIRCGTLGVPRGPNDPIK